MYDDDESIKKYRKDIKNMKLPKQSFLLILSIRMKRITKI